MLDVQSYRAWDDKAKKDVVLSKVDDYVKRLLHAFVSSTKTTEPAALDRICNALEERVREHASLPLERAAAKAGSPDGLLPLLQHLVHGLLCVEEQDWISDSPVTVLRTELTLATYIPRYLMLKALVDVLGRAPAKERMRQFLDAQIEDLPKPSSPPAALRELREHDIPWNQEDSGQDAISCLASEHQCLKKVTACRIQKMLAPFGDPDLMDVIACYPDFASIRRTNPHFVLTRTRNLILGDSCCDNCFHDTRGSSTISHPSNDTFDRLDYEEKRRING